mgnify:CR=1 FL=1
MAIPTSAWLPAAIGAGATLLGSGLQQKSANAQSAWQKDLIQQEMARRNAIQGQMAPQIGYSLGIRDPQKQQQFQNVMSGAPGAYSGTAATGNATTGNATPVPSTQGSKSSAILGAGSVGAGLAGAAGILPFAGPIGGALALGSLAASQIGKGRRTANVATGSGGFENEFGKKLATISAGQGGLPELQQAYNDYMQNVNAWRAMGGNHAKVAEQSLQNQPLQNTYQTLLQQLQQQQGAR